MYIIKEYDTDVIPKGMNHQEFKRLKELFSKSVKLPLIHTYKEISKRQKIQLKKITKKCMRKWNKEIIHKAITKFMNEMEDINEKIEIYKNSS